MAFSGPGCEVVEMFYGSGWLSRRAHKAAAGRHREDSRLYDDLDASVENVKLGPSSRIETA